MKHQPILSPLLVLLMLASAQAQKGDWQVVKNLASDQLISVQVRHHWIRLKCRFEYATDDQLLCSYGWPPPISEVAYPRDKILTVRVAHNTAAIGAGAGAVIGVSQNPINGLGRGGNALIDAGFFGLLGAGVGGLVSPYSRVARLASSPVSTGRNHHHRLPRSRGKNRSPHPTRPRPRSRSSPRTQVRADFPKAVGRRACTPSTRTLWERLRRDRFATRHATRGGIAPCARQWRTSPADSLRVRRASLAVGACPERSRRAVRSFPHGLRSSSYRSGAGTYSAKSYDAILKGGLMKTTRLIPLLIVLLLLASVSSGQTADWSAVEQLNQGTPISVKLRLHLECDFSYATETELVCEPRLQGRIPRRPIAFRRGAIRQVRIERVEASTVAGAVIGAGAGAAVGASSGNGSLTRGGGALLLGGIGGIVGGFVGKGFPFLHGEVVYQKP